MYVALAGTCSQAVTRSIKGQGVVDSFGLGHNLKTKVKLLLSTVMNKKQKQRWVNFVELAQYGNEKKKVPKFVVPNETRCSGVFMMFQSALRGRCILNVLDTRGEFCDVYKNLMLKEREWSLVAEFEAVMSLTHELAMASQTQHPGEMAFSWFNVVECRAKLVDDGEMHKFNVVDVSKTC